MMMQGINSCKKSKFINDADAKVTFSEDKVLFDTVFTSIGSATKNFRIKNPHGQKIKISSIKLRGGSGSSFIVNVDGIKGTSFGEMEIAAHDSMFVFVQVRIDPNNANSPLIVNDYLDFDVNGNLQTVELEAWGQDAYYHKPTNAIKFKDGSYLAYSLISSTPGVDTVWKNDKPHVIYGYLVVDSAQKLTIQAGVQIYLNYKAGLWVYKDGQIRVLGTKGNEVVFQGARREKDFLDEPGQWDRIWINEGSDNNKIDYAIIKNGFIGVQTEVIGDTIGKAGKLTLTNTKIQNMSMWGLYCLAYKVSGGNNVISNCQEHCLNIQLGGEYNFKHCTFVNLWAKDKARSKTCINLNNYNDNGVFPDSTYFGNCIIDGTMANEITLDLKSSTSPGFAPRYKFNNCWLKTNAAVTNTTVYSFVKTGTTWLSYSDTVKYNFEPKAGETRNQGFTGTNAQFDMGKFLYDINGKQRLTIANGGITVGAYENK